MLKATLYLGLQARKENKHVQMAWTATRGMHFSTRCDLLYTVQVQPVRATTPLALSWKKRGQKTRKSPTRQGGVVHPVLCCVWSAALLWHCWHTWYSTNLCEFANVEQVLVRWSLVPSGVATKHVGAPPACSRSARVVCEGRRLEAAATDCELAASSRAEISAWMACAV